jgi:hypothetical protein
VSAAIRQPFEVRTNWMALCPLSLERLAVQDPGLAVRAEPRRDVAELRVGNAAEHSKAVRPRS